MTSSGTWGKTSLTLCARVVSCTSGEGPGEGRKDDWAAKKRSEIRLVENEEKGEAD